MEHADAEVRAAIIKLDDALCSWERSTGIESVFILREQGGCVHRGFVHRALSGKPGVPDDITDSQLIAGL